MEAATELSGDHFDPVDVAAIRYIDVDDEAFLDELTGTVPSDEEEEMDDETGDLITTKKSTPERKAAAQARIVQSVKQSENFDKIENTFHEKLSTISAKYVGSRHSLEAKGMDAVIWHDYQDALKTTNGAGIEELRGLYKGFDVEGGISGVVPAMPKAEQDVSAEPKEKKRVRPEKIAEVGEYSIPEG